MTAEVSGYKKKKKRGAWNTQFYSLSFSLFKNLAQRAHLLPARDGAAVTWQRAQARCHLIWLPWLVSCLERAAQTQCGGLLEAMGRNAADWGWPCSSGGWRDTLSAGGSPLCCRGALGSASHSLPLAPSEGELCVLSPAPGHRCVLLLHKDDTPRAFGTPPPRCPQPMSTGLRAGIQTAGVPRGAASALKSCNAGAAARPPWVSSG